MMMSHWFAQVLLAALTISFSQVCTKTGIIVLQLLALIAFMGWGVFPCLLPGPVPDLQQ